MTSPQPAEEQYLRPAEAAKLLHVSPKTVDRWAIDGRIPCIVTLGGHRRFRLDDVLAVAEEMASPRREPERSKSASGARSVRPKS